VTLSANVLQMGTPLAIDLWAVRWCSYNVAVGSFHIRKFCSRLLLTELEFYWQKSKNTFRCHPLGDWGVTYTVHLWLVGSISANWTFLPALTVETLSGYWSKLCSKGGDSLWVQIFGEWGSPTNDCWHQKTKESLGYHVALFVWSYV